MSKHSDIGSTREHSCDVQIVDSDAVTRARGALSAESVVARATDAFAALGDPTRFRILEALAAGELCVCDLAEVAGISQSGVSHQLRLLRDRGLVTSRRDGQRAVYRLADEHVSALMRIGIEHASEVRP